MKSQDLLSPTSPFSPIPQSLNLIPPEYFKMLLSRSRVALISALSLLISFVTADARNWNPNGDGCVDSKGFLSCYQEAVDNAVGCVGTCNTTTTSDTYDDCLLGCGGYQLAANVGCWIESCWNEVLDIGPPSLE